MLIHNKEIFEQFNVQSVAARPGIEDTERNRRCRLFHIKIQTSPIHPIQQVSDHNPDGDVLGIFVDLQVHRFRTFIVFLVIQILPIRAADKPRVSKDRRLFILRCPGV